MEATKMNDAPKRLLNKRNGPNTLLGIAGRVSLIFGAVLFALGVWTNLHREGGPLVSSYRDDTIYVEAAYGKEARIPKDARLRARLMTPEADPEAYSQNMTAAMAAVGREDGDIPLNAIYNVGFYVGDQEVEPEAPVNVTVQVLKDGFAAGEPVKVVHLREDNAEVIADTAVDDAGFVSFTTDGFSDFVFVGNSSAMNGPATITLSETEDGGETKDPSDMGRLLRGVTIKDNKGEEVEKNGKLYVGESYSIHMEFREGGAQAGDDEQFYWNEESGTMTFQIPSSFQVDKYENVPLEITVGDQKITVGHYSIDENGLLTLTLTEEGKKALKASRDIALTFDMTATAQATEEGGDQQVHFGDVGTDFNFTVTDQPRLDVQKSGGFREDADGKGGTLSYTVTTTVAHGTVEHAQVTDVLTPPQTDAIQVGDYQNVKVTLKRASDGPDGKAVELKPDDYELVPGEPDPENPGKQTFIVKLKDPYATLNEGDVLNVSYEYDVDYYMDGVGLLSGSVFNEVTVRGSMPLESPGDPEGKPPVDVEEKRNSDVYINVTTTGDGVIFKNQSYNEATHTLHYTLYTVIPKGEWEPLFIQDDMYVNYGGERWYIEEFSNGDSRVDLSSLTVEAADLPNDQFGWKDTEDPDKLQGDLKNVEELHPLEGFDFYDFGNNSKPDGYEATNADGTTNVNQYVYYFADRTMYIIFGFDHTRNYNEYWGNWGSWNYPCDRLVITEYDLDLSPGTELTVKSLDTKTERTLTPEQILHAGVTNNVNLRFSKYNPGYVTFFNNIEDINKTGVPDKNTNTIDYTVTVGMMDDTVRDYFKGVGQDVYDSFDKYNSWDYQYTMQAVFYDVLPEGWEYVPGSLYAVTKNQYGGSTTFAYLTSRGSELSEDGRSISAPLINFWSGNLGMHDAVKGADQWTEISFHYTLKATRDWLMTHAEDKNAVSINNHAEIKDKNMTHWDVDKTIQYLPNRLTKTAQQVGSTNLIEFTLEMNQAGANLDPNKDYLIVKDESTGIEIQPESIVVSQVNDDGTVKALEDLGDITLNTGLGNDSWGRLPEEAEHQFRLKVPDGVSLRITYQALVTESGDSVPVSNKASIDGVERSNSEYKNSLKVNEIYGSGSGSVNELTFEKIDSTDPSKKLSGAKFKFYIVLQKGSGLEETDSIRVGEKTYSCYTKDDWVITTGEDGTFHIGGEDRNWNLALGNYYILVETKAPEGYKKLDPILFYFGMEKDIDTKEYPTERSVLPSGMLTVADPPIEYTLPETGGPGTFFYIAAGLALALGSGVLLTVRRRLRRVR